MSKEILEAVQGLGKTYEDKAAAAAKQMHEVQTAFDKKFADLEKVKTDEYKKLVDEVKQLNEDLIKEGKTLEEVRDQVKEMKAKTGRFKGGTSSEKSALDDVNETIEKHFAEIKAVVGSGSARKFEIKTPGTITPTNSLTGNVIATYDQTPAVRGRRKVNIRDIVPVVQSATGTWKFYQQNSPVGEGSIDIQGSAGGVKPQIDYDLSEKTVVCGYMSGFLRFDKAMANDLPFLTSFVSTEMLEDYKRSESQAFFTSLIGGAGGNTTTSASVLAEKYIDYIANLMSVDYTPTAIVTTAANWATILKTKPNDYSIPGGTMIDADGNIRFVGIPLIPQNNIAAGKTFIADFSKVALIQQEGISFGFYEQDSDNIQRNLITARVEARVALAVLRPDAVIYA